ncbi:RNase adapter RapZ [Magnetococcus sp. PR-3]|uniref:RNase adapter RapZ n=1 Tax=Magnetococcus sp. PR-3 TaxID=3120355 RepID=UPI002FCDF966
MEELGANTPQVTSLVLVAGLSGAGKSTALKSLEDIGFLWIDNPPLLALPGLLRELGENNQDIHVAVGLHMRDHSRDPDALERLYPVLNEMAARLELLYLEADSDILVKRFRETRRRHPLAGEAHTSEHFLEGRTVKEAVVEEKQLMQSVRANADLVIDTTYLRPQMLQERVADLFRSDPNGQEITLFVRSLGFKYGSNTDADMVLDARFLQNPYYDANLRPLTGLDKPVRDFLESDNEAEQFLDHLKGLFGYLIPRYIKERKCYFTVDIGCTGGQHRSVYLVDRLQDALAQLGYRVLVRHRDIHRKSAK